MILLAKDLGNSSDSAMNTSVESTGAHAKNYTKGY